MHIDAKGSRLYEWLQELKNLSLVSSFFFLQYEATYKFLLICIPKCCCIEKLCRGHKKNVKSIETEAPWRANSVLGFTISRQNKGEFLARRIHSSKPQDYKAPTGGNFCIRLNLNETEKNTSRGQKLILEKGQSIVAITDCKAKLHIVRMLSYGFYEA